MKRKAKRKKKKPGGMKFTGTWVIIVLIFIGELFFYTWCRVQYRGIGYEMSRESEKNLKLMALQKNLKIEIAHLKSPERIAKIAREQLGLSMPDPKQMVIIQ